MRKNAVSVLRPLGDRVVVERDEAPAMTPGGIALPDGSKDKPSRGRVVAVGPGKLLDDGSRAAMELAEGDTVVFGMYAGTEIEIGEKMFVVLREQDVLAAVV